MIKLKDFLGKLYDTVDFKIELYLPNYDNLISLFCDNGVYNVTKWYYQEKNGRYYKLDEYKFYSNARVELMFVLDWFEKYGEKIPCLLELLEYEVVKWWIYEVTQDEKILRIKLKENK